MKFKNHLPKKSAANLLICPKTMMKKQIHFDFLHGYGQSGDEKIRENGIQNYLVNWKQFPFVLVSPQCPTGFY